MEIFWLLYTTAFVSFLVLLIEPSLLRQSAQSLGNYRLSGIMNTNGQTSDGTAIRLKIQIPCTRCETQIENMCI